MGNTTKTVIATALLCVGGLFAYSLTQDPPPSRPSNTVSAEAAATSNATSSADGKQEEARRENVPAADAPVAWLDHPFLFELEALVVDPTGLPVEGHTLRLAPPGCTLNDAPKATGPDGRVSLSWRSRQPSGEIVFADERSTLRRVPVQHGAVTKLTLPGRMRGGGNYMSYRIARATEQLSVPVVTEIPLTGRLVTANLDDRSGFRSGLHPHAVFGTAGVPVTKAAEASVELDLSNFSFAFGNGEVRVRSSRIAGIEGPKGPPSEAKLAARIAGTVFGEDGKPAAKVPVALLGTGPQPVQRAETDDAGRFAFEGLQATEFTVRAGGTAAGLAIQPAITTTGTTPVTLNLRRDSCVRGRAVTATGEPLAKATIVWRANDGSWCDSAESAADGTFVLANLPGATGTVFLWAPGGERKLPVAWAANVLNDTGELSLQFDSTAMSTLRLDPILPDGIEISGLTVRVWSEDTGTGTRMPQAEQGQPWRLANLPAGWYRVELYTAATGWIDVGRHWVDGKGDCDLGRVPLPAPATARFAFAAEGLPGAEEQAFEVCALRTDVDVRIDANGYAPDGGLRLPPGDYVLLWKGKDGASRFHRFTAPGGKEVAVHPGH